MPATHIIAQASGLALAAPVLRGAWLIGLPVLAAFWATAEDRRLVPAALFAGSAAALLPPALFEVALPVILSSNPGGGAGMIGIFWIGIGAVLLAGLGAAMALYLRRRATVDGARLPLLPIALLFTAFHAAMIAPRATLLNETFLPGAGGPLDPLALLAPIAPLAPWIAAAALVLAGVVAARAPRMRR